MRMHQTIAGVPFVRSIVGYVGELDGHRVTLRHGTRGLYRWWVQRYQSTDLLGRGTTATEAINEARAWLARKQGNAA